MGSAIRNMLNGSEQTFFIFHKLLSLNEYRNAHYYKLNGIKKDWEYLTSIAIKTNNISPIKAAEIEFTLLFMDHRRRDLDNYSATIKMIIDGIVLSGILPDDSRRYIKRISIDSITSKIGEGIQVKLKEIET